MKKTLRGLRTLEGLTLAAVLTLVSQTSFAQTPITTIENSTGTTVMQSFEDGGLLLPGELGSGTLPVPGRGPLLMWHPGKAAFRVGYVSDTQWIDSNIGDYSTATGSDNIANGNYSTAMGYRNTAVGIISTTMGYFTTASGKASTTMGIGTNASGETSTAMGHQTRAATIASFSAGRFNNANTSDDRTLFVVGNGTNALNRSDALVLKDDGNMTIAGDLTENSDRRLKKEIQPMASNTLEKLRMIKPVRYQFKNQQTHPEGPQIGLIAQEVQVQFPELVQINGNGYLSVSYSKFTAVLLKGIQEQQANIEKLQVKANHVDKLEERLAILEQQSQQRAGFSITPLFFLIGVFFLGGVAWMFGSKKVLQGFGSLIIIFFSLTMATPANAQDDSCDRILDIQLEKVITIGEDDLSDDLYSVIIGVHVSGIASFSIPFGPDNFFSPQPAYRNQITDFTPSGDYLHFSTLAQEGETFDYVLCGQRLQVRALEEIATTSSGTPLMALETADGNPVLTITDTQLRSRATEGTYFFSEATGDLGVSLLPGTAGWSVISDSTKKERFQKIDGNQFIDKLREMPLGSWNYKDQPDSTRHYGPMAQDFFEAFGHDGLGTIGSDTTIATADADGVLFILAQALAEQSAMQATRINTLEKQVASLKQQNSRQAGIPFSTVFFFLGFVVLSGMVWMIGGKKSKDLQGFKNLGGLAVIAVLALFSQTVSAQTFTLQNGADMQMQNGGVLDLGTATTLAENGGQITDGSVTAARNLNAPSDQNVAGLGAIITSSENLGETVITRTHGIESIDGNVGINRFYDITPTNNSDLDATLEFSYYDSELNSLNENELTLYRSDDGGQTYTEAGVDSRDASANSLTLGSIHAFSRWTAAASQEEPITIQPDENNILYVNTGVESGTGSGNSWENAIPELADALDWARQQWDEGGASWNEETPLQIWAAEGVYYPLHKAAETDQFENPTTDRANAFVLVPYVQIYGGFPSNPTNDTGIGDRDWENHPTTLSGDLDKNEEFSDNDAYHVLISAGSENHPINEHVLLDGFTITRGYANANAWGQADVIVVNGRNITQFDGAGIITRNGSPTFKNLNISNNMASNSDAAYGRASGGGGMDNLEGDPLLMNVTFFNNTVNSSGGGMYNFEGSPTLLNVAFIENTSQNPEWGGGGLYNGLYSSPTLINVLFEENFANNSGGAIFNNIASPTLINVTITKNQANEEGAGIYNQNNSESELKNVIIWNNTAQENKTSPSASISNNSSTTTISHSLIANSGGSDNWNADIGNDGGENIDKDAVFSDPDNGIYTLQSTSPAINSGTNSPFENDGIADGITTDLNGNDRIYNSGTVDMGAYEYHDDPPASVEPNDDNVLFVDIGVEGGNESGNSWENAIPELRRAMNWAASNWNTEEDGTLQIWVAAGTYTPGEDGNQEATFQLVNNVEVYGGFEGNEESLNNRNWQTHTTILSGDIDDNDDDFAPTEDTDEDSASPSQTDHISGDNSYHVVSGNSTDNSALLDGFIVTSGFANGEGTNFEGGGMVNEGGDPMVQNIIFRGNKAFLDGGGMYNENSSPVLTNVTFRDNTSTTGGGIYNENSSPSLMNAGFVNNYASINGGGIYNYEESSITLINVLFADNTANQGGGGVFIDRDGSAEITNSTFVNNEATGVGGGIRTQENTTIEIYNSIIWGNSASQPGNEILNSGSLTLEYSLYGNYDDELDIDDDISGSGDRTINNSITDDPLFADPGNGDYSLTELSPAINKASNQLYTDAGGDVDNDTDLADNPRVFNGESDVIDMGAYEFQGEPATIQFAKSFDDPVNAGSNVTLEFTITNGSSEALNSLTFTDDLNAVLSGLEATGLPKEDVCGDGSEISGTDALSFSGGSVSSESSCSFEVTLQLPSDVSTGDYINTTSDLTSGGNTIAGPATDELTIQSALSGSNEEVLTNNQSVYVFEPVDDFGLSNENESVLIETVPDNGTLKLNDGEVVADQEISFDDIDFENFVWIPNDNTAYGINYDEFDFKIKDSSGNESEDTYTLTIHLADAAAELTGSEGWRFLTSPQESTYASFLDPISVETASASFPTLYSLDQYDYEWDAIDYMNSDIDPGEGFIVLVEEDDLPATLIPDESWRGELDESFTYEGLQYDDDGSSSNPGNFYLIGNPYPFALNFCEFTDSEIATSLYFWNPDAGAGFGDYVNVSCDLQEGEVLIAPYQAFWIRTTASNPSLTIPEDAYEESAPQGYFKHQEQGKVVAQKSLETSQKSTSKSSEKSVIANNEFAIELTIQDKEEEFSNSTHLFFSDEATTELDPIDAPKLSAAGLAERWVSLHSLDQQGNKYALQSLPPVDESAMNGSTQTDQQAKTTIPIGVQTTESRAFTFSWNLPDQQIFDGQYFLKDTRTGEVIELREGANYRFQIAEEQTAKVSGDERSAKSLGDFADLDMAASQPSDRLNPDETPRFELLVAASGIDGRAELGDLPDNFTLNQNYPNPFNPTTVISYELPQAADVQLDVYDMVGRHIATLVNEQTAAGRHTVNFDASQLSSGVYLYRLQAGSTVMTKKLTVVK